MEWMPEAGAAFGESFHTPFTVRHDTLSQGRRAITTPIEGESMVACMGNKVGNFSLKSFKLPSFISTLEGPALFTIPASAGFFVIYVA